MKAPRKQILTKQELKDIQQPLSSDGFTNPEFDKLYPGVNPHAGTDRDRVCRKGRTFFSGNPLAKKK